MQIAYRVHVKITAHAYPHPSGVIVHWNIQESFATSVSESISVFCASILRKAINSRQKWRKKFISIMQFVIKNILLYIILNMIIQYICLAIVLFVFETFHEVISIYLQFKLTRLRYCVLSLFNVVMRWMYTPLLQNVALENPQTLTKDLQPGFCQEPAPCCFCLPLSAAPCVLPGKNLHVNTLCSPLYNFNGYCKYLSHLMKWERYMQ